MNNSFNGLIECRDFEYAGLPSKGECYPHKKSRVPIRYMTADDENLFASQALWERNQVGDELLKRLILDDDFDVDELCVGDREALLCYIFQTAYGNSIITSEGEPVELASVKFKPFYMLADGNGLFDYVTRNRQMLKFHYLTLSELRSLNGSEYDDEYGFEREYLKLSLRDGIPSDMNESDISKLYNFIIYTAPGLDTKMALDDSLFLRFE